MLPIARIRAESITVVRIYNKDEIDHKRVQIGSIMITMIGSEWCRLGQSWW